MDNAYSPPEYQKRAIERERHTKEVAELSRFINWLVGEIGDFSLANIHPDEHQELIEEFLRIDCV